MDHDLLLSGWFRERQQQLQESLATTVQNGRLCTEANTWKFACLRLFFLLMQLIPPFNRMLERGPRSNGMVRYQWQKGLPFLDDGYGGMSLPQVYCSPISSSLQGVTVQFTDDVIFQQGKKGMFQLVVNLKNLADLNIVRESLSNLDTLSGHYIIPGEATFLLQACEVEDVPEYIGDNVFRLATADEFATIGSLCQGRPVPQYYDMFRLKKELHGKPFAVVRPDRFVYAACDTEEQLQAICTGIRQTLGLA